MAVVDKPRRYSSVEIAEVAMVQSPYGVEVASHDELRRFSEASLQALGLTFEELEEQAKRGSFASDRARLTCMALADLAHHA